MYAKHIVILLVMIINITFIAEAQTTYPMMQYETKGKMGSKCRCTVYTTYLQEYAFETCLAHKDTLQLSSDQINKIKTLQIKYVARIENLKNELSMAEGDLRAILKAKPFDHKKSSEKSKEIQKIQDDLFNVYHEIIEQIETVLTPRQKDLLYSLYMENLVH